MQSFIHYKTPRLCFASRVLLSAINLWVILCACFLSPNNYPHDGSQVKSVVGLIIVSREVAGRDKLDPYGCFGGVYYRFEKGFGGGWATSLVDREDIDVGFVVSAIGFVLGSALGVCAQLLLFTVVY